LINVTLARIEKFDINTFSIGINGCAWLVKMEFAIRYGAKFYGTKIVDSLAYTFPWARKESNGAKYFSMKLGNYYKTYTEYLQAWLETGKVVFEKDLQNFLLSEKENEDASETEDTPVEVAV
jgi:hypothetical protein